MKIIDENLPEPSGFRILLKPREIQEKTAGGIILADVSKDHQSLQTNVSKVLAMGGDCYTAVSYTHLTLTTKRIV